MARVILEKLYKGHPQLKAADFVDRPILLGLRPGDLCAVDAPGGIGAAIELAEAMGAESDLHSGAGAAYFYARASAGARYRGDQKVRNYIRLEHADSFDARSEGSIGHLFGFGAICSFLIKSYSL